MILRAPRNLVQTLIPRTLTLSRWNRLRYCAFGCLVTVKVVLFLGKIVRNSDLLVVYEPFVVFLCKPTNQTQEQTKQLNDAADDLEEYLQQLESLCAKYSSEIVSIEEDLALNAKFKEEVVCGTYDKVVYLI